MPLEKRLGGRSASLGGEAGTPWGSSGGRDQFQLSEQELADLRKLQQLHVSQARLRADGSAAFKPNSPEKDAAGELNRRRGLPPRAPTQTLAGERAPKHRDQQLSSIPSMVDRISDSSKAFVDPKDAQNLLPSALLDSSSLDLSSYLETFDPNRQTDIAMQLGGMGDPSGGGNHLDLAMLQTNMSRKQHQGHVVRRGQQGGFDVGVPGLESLPPPSIPPDSNVLPLRRRQIHHQRSNSEPVFSFPTYSANLGKGGQGGQGVGGGEVRSVPVLAVLPDYSVMPADLINGQALSARTPLRNVMPVRTRDRTMSFDHAALLHSMGGGQDRSGHNRRADVRADGRGPARRKNKSRSMSEDFGRPQQPNKASFPQKQEKKASTSKNAKSTPTKNEVKRLVNYQVLLARPIRTPWFRDTPRNPNSGDEEEQEVSDEQENAAEEAAEAATEPQKVSSPVSSPALQAAAVQLEESTPDEAPSTPTPNASEPAMGTKGTGFFCPSLH